MAPTLVGTPQAELLSGSGSDSFSLPRTTVAGDTIKVDFCIDGGDGYPPDCSISGGDASEWTRVILGNDSTDDPVAICWVGNDCSAGATTLTIDYPGGADGSVVISQWSGCASSPVGNTSFKSSGGHDPTSLTSNSVSFASTSVVTGAMSYANEGGDTASVVWSNGATDIPIANVDTVRSIWADYIAADSTSPTTATWTIHGDEGDGVSAIYLVELLSGTVIVDTSGTGSMSFSGLGTATFSPPITIESIGLITTSWSATGFVLTGASIAPTQEILSSTQWSAGAVMTTDWIA